MLIFRLMPQIPRGRHRTHSMSNMQSQDLSPSSPTSLSINQDIVLRPFQMGDEKSLTEHANNRNIWRNLNEGFPFPYTIDDGKRWVEYNVHAFETMMEFASNKKEWEGKNIPFLSNLAIVIKSEISSDVVIGSIGFEFCYFHIASNKSMVPTGARLGYWISESYWNQGIITAAIKTFLKQYIFGFLKTDPFNLDIQRVEARVFTSNPQSSWILEKMGFQKEGTFRKTVLKDGVWKDENFYALVRDGLDSWNSQE